MHLNSSKEFPYTMDVAWQALHQPAKLDVEPGSMVTVLSDTQWQASNTETGAVTLYTASFDDDAKKLTIEGASNKKHDHDFIYLTLSEVAEDKVALDIEIRIETGMHVIAKALGAILSKPMQEIMCKHIYHNFDALCLGSETKTLSNDDLKDIAKKTFEK